MSEYQYYEFQAIDRPLSKGEQATLRACSTRARISASRFVNEYHWSGLKADPMKWMTEYFDAHVYLSNFGSSSFHLRFPLALLTTETTRDYEEGGTLETRTTPTHLILSFLSEEESGENYRDDDGEGVLGSLLPIREALSSGDLRALYLAWLLAVQQGRLEAETLEPPVPVGLASLSGSLEALAQFLQLDPDLIAVAARNSLPAAPDEPSAMDAQAWLATRTPKQKDAWLLRFLTQKHSPALLEFKRVFRCASQPATPPNTPRRSADELLAASVELARLHSDAEAQHAAAKRLQYLQSLAGNEANIWKAIVALTNSSTASYYDSVVQQLLDLRDIAKLNDEAKSFARQLAEFRDLRRRRSSLIARLDQAGLT